MFDKMVVYCARYRMDRAGGKIVFDMEFGHSPNLTGSTRERRFQLKGDALILFPNTPSAGRHSLVGPLEAGRTTSIAYDRDDRDGNDGLIGSVASRMSR